MTDQSNPFKGAIFREEESDNPFKDATFGGPLETVEEKKAPFTGEESPEEGGYYPNPVMDNYTGHLTSPDRMETPITEEEMSNYIVRQVVESDAYKEAKTGEERQQIIDTALTDTNRRIFESKGEQWTGNARKEVITDEEGNKRTYIVPAPGADSKGFQRGVGGAILNIVGGVGGTIEKGGNIPFTDIYVPGTDKLGITDSETSYFKEDFPRYPSASAMEDVAQEVIPIIVGSLTGAGAVKKLDDISGLSPKMANWISKRWDEAKRVDPKNAKKNLELMLKGIFIERGANLGATLTTPEDMEPLIGDNVLKMIGMNPEENRDLGHYIDNEAFTALGTVALKTVGGIASWVGNKIIPTLSKNNKKREAEVALLIIKQIDPGITDDLPAELLAERARLLGQVILNNKEFQLGLLGQKVIKNADGAEEVVDMLPGNAIQLDSGTALALGAREYVESAYGWMKATMKPAEYERTINQYAQGVIDNIVGLKQGRRGNQVVQAGEAQINQDATRVLTNAADEAIEGGSKQADQAGVLLGQDIVETVGDATNTLEKSRIDLNAAEATATINQDKDYIISMLEKARGESSLGNTTTDMQTLANLTGEDLFNGWERSFKSYNKAFDDLPDGIPVDMADLKSLMEELSKKTNDFDTITVSATKEDPFREMLKGIQKKVKGTDAKGNPILETEADVLSRLDNIDLKFLYKNVRPELSRRLNLLEKSGMPTPPQLIQLKNWIDAAADASGQPEFAAAMDLYKKHAADFMRTDDLAQYEAKARKVRLTEVAGGVRMGQDDVYETGMQVLANAEQALTPGKMEAFLNALSTASGKDVAPEMAQAYVGLAMRALTRSTQFGEKVSSGQVKQAIQPYLKQLERTNPEAVGMFEETVKTLEMVELGLTNAKQANVVAEQAYQKIMTGAQETAASRFVNNLTGSNPTAISSPQEVFKSVFNAANAPDLMEQLLKQADSIGNPLIRDGLKSKYVSYLKDRIFTNKRIGSEVTPDGVGATKELSPTQLSGILSEEFDNTLSTLRVVFKDEPQKAEALTSLLDVLDVAVNNRAIRGNNFGSSTVLDEKLKEKMNRLIVFTMGVLNPVATKARNISAAVIDGRNQEIKEAIERQIDFMITSPQYFSEVMERLAKRDEKGVFSLLTDMNMIRGGLPLVKERSEPQLGSNEYSQSEELGLQ